MKNRQDPEILFIVNRPNWAHDYKTRNLQRVLGNEYRIVKRYQSEATEADLDRADLILVYFWLQLNQTSNLEAAFMRNWRKLLIGVVCHLSFEGELREPGLATLRKLARGVFVIDLQLYR